MAAPIILGPWSELYKRPFAFYPAIVGIEHNEWRLLKATWTELHVLNTKTQAEVFVPRRLLHEISSAAGPVVIAGLLKELEYKEGVLIPHHRRVIEMPRAVNGGTAVAARPAYTNRPASVVQIRTDAPDPWRSRRILRGTIAAIILTCVIGGVIARDVNLGWGAWGIRGGMLLATVRPLHLTAADDLSTVVAKLGQPSSDEWLKAPSGVEYRKLWYPRRGVAVILAGSNHDSAHYAGALTWSGQLVHSQANTLMRELATPR